MANSSYWLGLKNETEKKLNKVKDVLDKLINVKSVTFNLPEKLRTSENEFETGGYNDGDTLDRGVLQTNYLLLDDVNSSISNVIYKLEMKKKDYENQIILYNNNYKNALLIEQK